MRILCSALIICFIFSGCLRNDKPENMVEEDIYIDLLVELQLLKTYQQLSDSSTNIDSLQSVIYTEYGVTEKQFQESHAYYQQDIKKHGERIKKAIEGLRKDRLQPQDTTATKDSTIIK